MSEYDILKAEMKEGIINPLFYKDIEKEVLVYDEDLKEIFNNFHHVDTYHNPGSEITPHYHFWRVQGWIYLADLPHDIPDELVNANCRLRERSGRAVIEVWSMILSSQLPF